ncbi:hypothetical protein, partial [Gordonibacter sp.]|uniref:hypothetical protein n=1 Tax=Gordonibacter sp. TaxID=1968902 RepID=UPI002FC7C89C
AKRRCSPLASCGFILPRTAAAESAEEPTSKTNVPAPQRLAERINNLYVELLASLYETASGKRDAHDKDAR